MIQVANFEKTITHRPRILRGDDPTFAFEECNFAVHHFPRLPDNAQHHGLGETWAASALGQSTDHHGSDAHCTKLAIAHAPQVHHIQSRPRRTVISTRGPLVTSFEILVLNQATNHNFVLSSRVISSLSFLFGSIYLTCPCTGRPSHIGAELPLCCWLACSLAVLRATSYAPWKTSIFFANCPRDFQSTPPARLWVRIGCHTLC